MSINKNVIGGASILVVALLMFSGILILCESESSDAAQYTENGVVYTIDGTTAYVSGCVSANLPTSLTIPGTISVDSTTYNVTSIDEYAFEECTALTSVTIGNNVTSVLKFAFLGCTALTTVSIGSGMTDIDPDAFYECTALKTVTVDDANTTYCSVNNVIFSEDQKTIILYPAGIESETYTIPDSVTIIGKCAFQSSAYLKTITIPDAVTTLNIDTFYACTALTSVTIGSGVTAIGANTFYACTALTSVTIPDSVTIIDEYAFEDCTALTSVTIGSGVTSIGEGAFDYDFYDSEGNKLTSVSQIAGNGFIFSNDYGGYTMIKTYTITLSVDPSAGGTVTGAGTYKDGAGVTITATASDGYTFAGWYSGDTKISGNASYTFTATGDVTYTADFAAAPTPSSGGSNTWIWIVAAIVIVLVLLFVVYFFFIKTGKLKI